MDNGKIRLGLVFVLLFSFGDIFCQISVIDLNRNWSFRQAGTSSWIPANVPGCVHTDLLLNKKIEDPFFRNNEKEMQWIGEKDWEYQTHFRVEDSVFLKERTELVFQGLDTYADIYLNDSLLLRTCNMHREWRKDCKPFIHCGENSLRVYFHSVFQVDIPKYLAAPFKLSVWPNNDQGDMFLSVYARKAGFEYGWDWGPRLITSGIWKPAFIEAWDAVKLSNVQVIQEKVTDQLAHFVAVYEIESTADADVTLSVNLETKNLTKLNVKLLKGINHIPVPFDVKHPKLWWTNGIGTPYLYPFKFNVIRGMHFQQKSVSVGIRTLSIVREQDKDGKSMFVQLNNVPVFMKGANYIPLDIFLNRVTPDQYESIVKSAAVSHMNMLRVWGGGTYEKDLFYDLCDRYGILVFQDMMFACGMFPADDAFLENVSSEITENVSRLRNHPCIALWCGNNENEISYYGWGWKDKYTPDIRDRYEKNMKELFDDIVPNAIRKADTTRYYHSSSPSTGYNGIASAMGDVHYYGVWKGAPFEAYNINIGRFMSEYGFQGFPEMKSLQSFTLSSDLEPYSTVMLSHQRAKDDETRAPDYGTRMIEKYMEMYFHHPKDFESFVYVSQVLQAKGIVTAIEAHRRNMPFCMGSLYWQLNDCWPVISWSGIDYYGRWKALQYRVKEVYKDVLVSCIIEDGKLRVYIVSDRLKPFQAQLNLNLIDFTGNVLLFKIEDKTISANTSKIYFEIDTAKLFHPTDAPHLVFTIQVKEKGVLTAVTNFFFRPEKNLDLKHPLIEKSVQSIAGTYFITLKTSTLAKSVYVSMPGADGIFSDNYFDLLPGQTRIIEFKPDRPVDHLDEKLRIMSLVDSY